MTGPTGALAFLIVRTLRNRTARRLARLRNPRYLIGLIVGVVYFWFVFIGRSRSPVFLPAGGAVVGTPGGGIAVLGFAIAVITRWLSRGTFMALAFDPADVHFLFPAPVSRRMLLVYKVVRSQLVLVVNAFIFALIIRRWGATLALPLRALAAWGYFTLMSLHRLGITLVMVPPLHGARRIARYAGAGVALAISAVLVAAIGPILLRLGEVGFSDTLRNIGEALALPPVSYALAPFELVVAPAFAPNAAAWVRAFAPVLGLIVLHVVWVLSMRVEFEEQASAASIELARIREVFRERRAGSARLVGRPKTARSWLPLAPVGRPSLAITWKNTLALTRTGGMRSLLVFVVILVIVSRIISTSGNPRAGFAGALPFLGIAAMTLVMGPRILRNDLRQDMTKLSLLKSYPLRGAEMVAAELASPVLVLTAFQLVMGAIAYFSLPDTVRDQFGGIQILAAAFSPFALLALNAVAVAIQNAAALLFPTWVRLGPDSGGVEAIGQNLLMAGGSLVALVLMLVVPLATGGLIVIATRSVLGALAPVLAGLAILGVLGVEISVLIFVLGKVFERTEPTMI